MKVSRVESGSRLPMIAWQANIDAASETSQIQRMGQVPVSGASTTPTTQTPSLGKNTQGSLESHLGQNIDHYA